MTIGPIRRDGATAAFLDAAAAGTFLLRRCRPSGHWAGPQEQRCSACGSTELVWEPASGRARLVSFSVAQGPPGVDGVRPQTVVGIGELEEGPWWWTQIVDAEVDTLAIGDELVADFAGAEGYETVPVFRLA